MPDKLAYDAIQAMEHIENVVKSYFPIGEFKVPETKE